MKRRLGGSLASLHYRCLILKSSKNTNRSGGKGLDRKGRNLFLEDKSPVNELPEPPSKEGKVRRLPLLWT